MMEAEMEVKSPVNIFPEDPKVEDPKVEDPKVEDPKVEDPKVEDPKVEDNGKLKVGDVEVSHEDAITRLQWLNDNEEAIQGITPLLKALSEKDHKRATELFKEMAGEPEAELEPDDLKGRLDKIESEKLFDKQSKEADVMVKQIAEKIGEEFDSVATLSLLNDAGYGYDPAYFPKQLEMAHQALQYTGLKTTFDEKVKTAVAAELETEKRRIASAGSQTDGVGAGANVEKDYSGTPDEVIKRHKINIFDKE